MVGKDAVLTGYLMFREAFFLMKMQLNKHISNLMAILQKATYTPLLILHYLKSFFKFPIITFVGHIGFSASPNNTCTRPWLGVEKCLPNIYLKATPLLLIYKSVMVYIGLFGKSSAPNKSKQFFGLYIKIFLIKIKKK